MALEKTITLDALARRNQAAQQKRAAEKAARKADKS